MTEINGDLIKLAKDENFDIIVHGCNCQRKMGAGIALTLKQNFPEVAYQDSITKCNTLGNIDEVHIKNYKFKVINAYTQNYWGKCNKYETQNSRYNAIRKCMKKINERYKGLRIGLPLIGCGKAGGDWKIVKEIIKDELKDCNVTVVHFSYIVE